MPCSARRPSSSTRRVPGYFDVSHAGGAAVGVPRTTTMLRAAAAAMARLSHAKSKWPSEGSIVLQANSPTRTTCIWAACMRSRSAAQRDSGHCSGYHAAPRRIAGFVWTAGCAGEWLAMLKSAATVSVVVRTIALRGLCIYVELLLSRKSLITCGVIRSWKLNYRSYEGYSADFAGAREGSACRERCTALFEPFISRACGIDCECSEYAQQEVRGPFCR